MFTSDKKISSLLSLIYDFFMIFFDYDFYDFLFFLYAYVNEYFFFKTTIVTIHLCKTSQSKILEGLVLKFAHLT